MRNAVFNCYRDFWTIDDFYHAAYCVRFLDVSLQNIFYGLIAKTIDNRPEDEWPDAFMPVLMSADIYIPHGQVSDVIVNAAIATVIGKLCSMKPAELKEVDLATLIQSLVPGDDRVIDIVLQFIEPLLEKSLKTMRENEILFLAMMSEGIDATKKRPDNNQNKSIFFSPPESNKPGFWTGLDWGNS